MPSPIESGVADEMAARQAWLRSQSEPLDQDTIELLRLQLEESIGKVNRCANLLLNRSNGLPDAAIMALHQIKSGHATLRWYLDKMPGSVARQQPQELTLLVQAHLHDSGPLGDAARKLIDLLPNATET